MAVPVQLLADGVTVTVEVIVAVPLLAAVNDAIFPDPEAARPVAVLLFVHAKDVPLALPLKLTADVASPLHTS